MCLVCDAQKLSYGNGTAASASAAQGPAYGGNAGNFQAFQGATGDQNIDGLLDGNKWGSLSLSYAFPTLATQYEVGYTEPTFNFGAATAEVQAATRFALTLLSQYTNMVVSEVNPVTTTADIRVAFSSEANPTAYAYPPDDYMTGGDVWLGTDTPEYLTPIKGQYAWHTMLHELGHALGLKHGQETGGVAGVAMDAAHDQMPYSVMTYRSYQGAPLTGYSNELNGYAQTYMMYDIAAFQAMYGANFNTNASNTTYRWSATTGEMSINGVGQGAPGGNRIFMTLWDGNGVDTYDFSNYTTALNINLAPGGFSVTSAVQTANLGSSHMAPGNIFNALLYNNDRRSLIENVVGGSAADTILGNVANNRIQGGGGADLMYGGAGNDTFILDLDNANDGFNGGDGTGDIADLGLATGNVSVAMTGAGSGGIFGGGLGSDSFSAIEIILGSNFVDTFVGGAGTEDFRGRLGNDVFIDGGGIDTMQGDENDDTAFFTADGANDTFAGGTGSADVVDYFYASAGVTVTFSNVGTGSSSGGGTGTDSFTGVERVYGSAFGDLINGSSGADYMYGRAGNDAFFEGFGIDIIYGAEDNDVTSFIADGANDYFHGGTGTDIVDLFYATSGVSVAYSVTLTGGVFGGGLGSDSFVEVEQVFGSLFGDTFSGGANNDYFYGRAGNDTFYDGAGTDQMFGAEDDDRMFFNADAQVDSFDGGAGLDDAVDLYFATSGVTLTFSVIGAGSLSGGGLGADTFTGVETVNGSNFADIITGSTGSEYFYARDGADTLRGGQGADSLWGVGGNDTFQFNIVDFQSGVNDRIGDFHLLGGDTDTLKLQGSAGLYSFANNGANVAVTHLATGGTMTIDAMTTAQLSGHILYF